MLIQNKWIFLVSSSELQSFVHEESLMMLIVSLGTLKTWSAKDEKLQAY